MLISKGSLFSKNQTSSLNNSGENHISDRLTDGRTDKVNYRVGSLQTKNTNCITSFLVNKDLYPCYIMLMNDRY